ncbi:MAG: hypothetical protein NC483_00580 [Ruminococcus sp.]|nr:hypothetical protein [Ruminococcus sp.]
MNYKYMLLVKLKNNKLEGYYFEDINLLYQYKELRSFKNYEIYELKKMSH